MNAVANTVSNAGDDALHGDALRFPALLRPVEWMDTCGKCGGEQRFVATRAAANGLIGRCAACKDERVAPWTRANSGAA